MCHIAKSVRGNIFQAGLLEIWHTPSLHDYLYKYVIPHFILFYLFLKYGHYIQAINYPTVPRGAEKLRLAPTPHHSQEMMDQLAEDLLKVWIDVGLPLKPRMTNLKRVCPQGGEECIYCKKPVLFEKRQARTSKECTIPNCPQMILAC